MLNNAFRTAALFSHTLTSIWVRGQIEINSCQMIRSLFLRGENKEKWYHFKMFICGILTEKPKSQACMVLCCQPLLSYRMKGLNFHGLIRSHGQASILLSCELQHSALCKLHLVGDEIDFQVATKSNTQKKNQRCPSNLYLYLCLRQRQWKVRYCSTESASIFIGLSIKAKLFSCSIWSSGGHFPLGKQFILCKTVLQSQVFSLS